MMFEVSLDFSGGSRQHELTKALLTPPNVRTTVVMKATS